MFLKAGAVSLALLLASRVFGLVRESSLAAAFGTSGMADVAVLMLTLPDWLAGVLASGALAYVLVPAWAAQTPAQVRASERAVGIRLVAAAALLSLLLLVQRDAALQWLAGGTPAALRAAGLQAIAWSAVALPAALLAAVWSTRLQHEQDFTGMYSANLVVNALLIAAIAGAAFAVQASMEWLGGGLIVAMLARLAWLRWRTPAAPDGASAVAQLPAASVWAWAALAAGLPLALPFVARSIASQAGVGALATFNYAWKLVELPLLLAIQLAATVALPAIAKALASQDESAARRAIRSAFALAWALACAAAAALLVGAPAVARLLFGWGRMNGEALTRVADWGALGAWGLLPQAVIAVSLAVLAGRGRMKAAVIGYAGALLLLLAAGAAGWTDGARLMVLLDVLFAAVAACTLLALGPQVRSWLPWRSMLISLAGLLVVAGIAGASPAVAWGLWPGLAAAAVAATLVLATTWWGSVDLRAALAR